MEKTISKRRTALPYLPENIVEEILLRLPAKSIVKFRAATKLFNHLSTLPSFVSAHTQRSLAAPPSLLVLLPERLERFLQINPDDESCINYFYLQGTCDGLLLFSEGSCPVFTVVNPVTGQWTPASVAVEDTGCNCVILSFYRHRSSGRHRLLILLCTDNRYLVLTIGSNEVRELEQLSSKNYKFLTGREHRVAGSDGKLYVLALGETYDERPCVVIFDTEKESLDSIVLPSGSGCLLGNPDLKLMEMAGRVCLYKMHPNFGVDMWVLVNDKGGVWVKRRTRTEVVQGWVEGLFVVDFPNWLALHFMEKKKKLLLARWSGNDICSTEKEFNFYCLDYDVVREEVAAMRRSLLLCNPSLYDDEDDSSSLCIAGYRECLTIIDI